MAGIPQASQAHELEVCVQCDDGKPRWVLGEVQRTVHSALGEPLILLHVESAVELPTKKTGAKVRVCVVDPRSPASRAGLGASAHCALTRVDDARGSLLVSSGMRPLAQRVAAAQSVATWRPELLVGQRPVQQQLRASVLEQTRVSV